MANGTDLISSIIWSKKEQSLSKFLKDYDLPQIIRVVDGFNSKVNETSIPPEEILVLQEKLLTRKLVGTDSFGRQVAIALSCPTKLHVRPLKSNNTPCKVEGFKAIFPKVQYLRVKSSGIGSESDDVKVFPNSSLVKVGDLLQIKKLKKKKKAFLCQNIDTKEDVTLFFKHPALFTPLLDYQKYTLSEVVTEYGLPARVSFEHISTSPPVVKNFEISWENALRGLNEVVFTKEVTEVKILATTVGGVGEVKKCLSLPTDLPIQCTVVQRLTANDRKYKDALRTLHKKFNGKQLAESERFNVFQDINVIQTYYLNESESTPTVAGPQLDEKPSLRKKAKTLPKISPKPRRKTKDDPQFQKDLENTLASSNHVSKSLHGTPIAEISRTRAEHRETPSKDYHEPSRNLFEHSTAATEDYDHYIDKNEISPKHALRGRPDNCATVVEGCKTGAFVEDNHVKTRTFDCAYSEINKIALYNQNDTTYSSDSTSEEYVDMSPRQIPPLPGNLNAQSLSKIQTQNHFTKEDSTTKALSNQSESTSKQSYSHQYEEVDIKPRWLSNFRQTEFAVPSLTRDNPQTDSDYVIPLITQNVEPQPQFTKKYQVIKVNERPDEKHSLSYANVEMECNRNSGCAKNEQFKASIICSKKMTDRTDNVNAQTLNEDINPKEHVSRLSEYNVKSTAKQAYENAVPSKNWGSIGKQKNLEVSPKSSDSYLSYENVFPQTAMNFKSGKASPKKFDSNFVQVGQKPRAKTTKNDVLTGMSDSEDLNVKFRGKSNDKNGIPNPRISQIPKDLSLLTVEDVGNVLRCLNMHDYLKLFKDEMIDGAILKDLDLETCKALKVDLFHAKKLLKFINGWRPLK